MIVSESADPYAAYAGYALMTGAALVAADYLLGVLRSILWPAASAPAPSAGPPDLTGTLAALGQSVAALKSRLDQLTAQLAASESANAGLVAQLAAIKSELDRLGTAAPS